MQPPAGHVVTHGETHAHAASGAAWAASQAGAAGASLGPSADPSSPPSGAAQESMTLWSSSATVHCTGSEVSAAVWHVCFAAGSVQ